jgi:hypothetical protein
MKSKLIALVCAFGVLSASGQQAAVYSDTEAANHIGEEATVTGKVFGVSTSKTGTTYVNLGGSFPQHTFAGVIFVSKQSDVGDVKQYEGKDVSLTGRITLSPRHEQEAADPHQQGGSDQTRRRIQCTNVGTAGSRRQSANACSGDRFHDGKAHFGNGRDPARHRMEFSETRR